MTKQPGSSSRWNKSLYSQRWYVFTVVSLASLLIGMVFLYPRGSKFVVESVIKYDSLRAPSTATDQPERLEDRVEGLIRSDVAIRTALQEMDPASITELGALATDTSLVKQRLYVRTRPLSDEHEIRIRFLADKEAVGVDFVDRVAREFVDTQRANSDQWISAEREMQEWEGRVHELNSQLTSLVDTELQARRQQFDVELVAKRQEQARQRDAREAARQRQLAAQRAEEQQRELAAQPLLPPAPAAVPIEQSTKAVPPAVPAQEAAQAPLPDAPSLPTEPPTPNPRWLAMDDELSQNERELRQMLTLYTLEHPFVQAAQRKIDTLRSIRDELPRFLGGELGQPHVDLVPMVADLPQPNRADPFLLDDDTEDPFFAVHAPQPSEAERPSLVPPTEAVGPNRPNPALEALATDETVAEPVGEPIDEILDAGADAVFDEVAVRDEITVSQPYVELIDRHQHAQDELAAAAEHFASVQLAEEGVEGVRLARIVEPARVIRKQVVSLSPIYAAVLFGLAVALGGVASCVRGKFQLPEVVVDVADVEEVLGLNVVGALSTNDGPQIPSLIVNQMPLPMRWLVRAGEAAVVASAAIVLVSFVIVPKFAGLFVANPFSAFVFVIDRFGGLLF